MILDARSVPDGTVIETEVCIVGAGAAGITLAREFTSAKFRVAVLESGGLELEPDTQDLYEGKSIGWAFEDLMACRLRFFGGTTNHWAGWCLPYDAIDFETRAGLPYRGWPFDKVYLDPWYQRAQEVCQIGPYEYAPCSWGIRPSQIAPPFKGPHFVLKILQKSPPTRFGAAYGPELRQASRVTVYLHANCLRLAAHETTVEVAELSARTLGGNRFTVRAQIYVIAAGGIENARLLLLSGKTNGNGLGNLHDCVGRFFMVNLNYSGGVIVPSDPRADLDFLTGLGGAVYAGFGRKQALVSFVGLSEQTMRSLHLPGIKIRWQYQFPPGVEALRDLKRRLTDSPDGNAMLSDLGKVLNDLESTSELVVRKALFHQRIPVQALELVCYSEQLPNRDSRVLLSSERDALGQRKVMIDWQVTPEDRQMASTTLHLLGTEIGRVGFGRLRSSLKDDTISWPEDFYGDEHHVGTTRMSREPSDGVVDENCRVHGLSNVYIAGSSVFPTTSANNPTLTIVALALRLADHIKKHFA